VNLDSLKLTAYFGERQRVGGRFFADVLLDLCGEREIATSLLLRGAEGFGLSHALRTDRLLTLSEDLPLVAVAVDTRDRVEQLLDDVRNVDHRGLVTLERARMLRDDIGPVALPEDLHEATKLTVYVGRQERVYRTPAFVAVCDLLHRRGVAGATVLLGVDGTAHGRRARARFFGRNADVPMMVIAVGSGERIGRVLPELGGLLRRPMVTLERVRVCKQRGQLLARPHELPHSDRNGLALWQKLMVFTSERAMHDGQPVHQSLVRRLRQTGARDLGLPRGTTPARRPPAAARARRPGGHGRHRHPGPDRAIVRRRRRAHRRARGRHQRARARLAGDHREGTARRARPRPLLLLSAKPDRAGGCDRRDPACRAGAARVIGYAAPVTCSGSGPG
jgi:PII-like signaling protein